VIVTAGVKGGMATNTFGLESAKYFIRNQFQAIIMPLVFKTYQS